MYAYRPIVFYAGLHQLHIAPRLIVCPSKTNNSVVHITCYKTTIFVIKGTNMSTLHATSCLDKKCAIMNDYNSDFVIDPTEVNRRTASRIGFSATLANSYLTCLHLLERDSFL